MILLYIIFLIWIMKKQLDPAEWKKREKRIHKDVLEEFKSGKWKDL